SWSGRGNPTLRCPASNPRRAGGGQNSPVTPRDRRRHGDQQELARRDPLSHDESRRHRQAGPRALRPRERPTCIMYRVPLYVRTDRGVIRTYIVIELSPATVAGHVFPPKRSRGGQAIRRSLQKILTNIANSFMFPRRYPCSARLKLTATAVEMQPKLGRIRRRKARFQSLSDLDMRTHAGQRAKGLLTQFTEALGAGEVTDGMKLFAGRAAVLCALAEDTRMRRLNGDASVNLDDLVRLDRVAAAAVRSLGIRATLPKPATPSLADYARARAEASRT